MVSSDASKQEIGDLSGLSFPSSVEYTLLKELGRGGMGIVFLGERNACGVEDEVVLKTVLSISQEYIDELKNEANIATGLRHENIVKTYGLECISSNKLPGSLQNTLKDREEGASETIRRMRNHRLEKYKKQADQMRHRSRRRSRSEQRDVFLICMDYVEGMDLGELHKQHLRRNLLIPVPLAAFIISRMCRALAYAHPRIIHRDISPGNILMNRQGVCKLTDFGVAVESDQPVELIVGKFRYMAPEQLRQSSVDGRSDLYSLGLVAYQLLTGIPYYQPPSGFDMTEKLEYVRSLHDEPPPAPNEVRPDVPDLLSKIVTRMIREDPSERFDDASTAGDALEQKYLYAEGFGPTNNSLRAYIDIFESGFKNYSKKQLSQLRFMKRDEKGYEMKRRFDEPSYSQQGLNLLHARGYNPTSSE